MILIILNNISIVAIKLVIPMYPFINILSFTVLITWTTITFTFICLIINTTWIIRAWNLAIRLSNLSYLY